MAQKKNSRGSTKKEAKPQSASKNGKKDGGAGSSFFTWFMVLALLGVWTSVAVVWFDLVDYDDVLARAKEFRYNISEVLQGKLGAYDADGDGDFDVEDAKVLLGLKEKPTFVVEREAAQDALEPPVEEPEVELEPEPVVAEEVIQPSFAEEAAQPPPEPVEEEPVVEEEVESQLEPEEEDEAPEAEEIEVPEEQIVEEEVEEEEEETAPEEVEEPVEEEPEEAEEEPEVEAEEAAPVPEEAEDESAFVEEEAAEDSPDTATVAESEDDVDSEGDDIDAHPYEDNTEDVIDTVGEIVEDALPEETVEESQDESAAEESQLTEEAGPESEFVAEEEEEEEELPQEELLEVDQGDEPFQGEEEEYFQEEAAESQEEAPIAEEPADEEVAPAEDQPVEESPEEPVQAEDQYQDEPAGTAEAQQEEKPKEKAKKKKPKLLNKFDKTIKAEIDAAEKLRKKGKVEEAFRAYESLVQKYPQSPRSRYGKALAEDDMAEKMRSNDILLKAINTYREASELPDAPEDLVKATLKKRAERQQFMGRLRGALATLERLVQIFPEDVSLKNDLGVGYLLMSDNKNAKRVYEEVLAMAPDDGFAKVHYGFILKSDNKIAESIPFLREGLESGDPGTDDGRFYFHLGDALQRVGDDSAYEWYKLGHQRGHFASVWQRSLYNVDGLKAQAWWTARETGYTDLVKTLERNWKTIRDEALSLMDATVGLFVPEDENLREKGEWGQFTLWQQGKKVESSCRSAPKTCALLDRYPEATGCKRGQIKYSVMQPGTHVWPHTGPTNCRLRMHLGLVIPPQGCSIRCTNQTRAWEEGRVLIFDDSFEHEVWQDAASVRLIFIVDVWHPELTQQQRQTLSPI